MFWELELPSLGAKSTDGLLIGHGLLTFRAGSPKTRMEATLDLSELERLNPLKQVQIRLLYAPIRAGLELTMHYQGTLGVSAQDKSLVRASDRLRGKIGCGNSSAGGNSDYILSARVVCDGLGGNSTKLSLLAGLPYTHIGNLPRSCKSSGQGCPNNTKSNLGGTREMDKL